MLFCVILTEKQSDRNDLKSEMTWVNFVLVIFFLWAFSVFHFFLKKQSEMRFYFIILFCYNKTKYIDFFFKKDI